MGLSRWRAMVALLALAGGCAAGCGGGDPKPNFAAPTSDPPTSQTTQSSPPTVSGAPTPTEDTTAATKQGAYAFADHYWDVVFYAQKTGDVRALKALGQSTCAGCKGGIGLIEKVYERDGRVLGGDLKGISNVSYTPLRAGTTTLAKVIVDVTGTPQRVVGAGKLDGTYGGKFTKYSLILIRKNGRWLVSAVDTAK